MKKDIPFITKPQPPKPENFVYVPNNPTLLKYYQAIYKSHAYANNFGLALDDDDREGKGNKPVLLSKLFVPPKLAADHILPEELIFAELDTGKKIPERWDFHTILKDHQRLFILGDPGTGKSTLINWLMLELSFSGDNVGKSALGQLVPFSLILRDMELELVDKWADLWQSWLKANPDFAAIISQDEATLKQILDSGQTIFLLDGLDEITHLETRRRIGKALLDGFHRHPRCRFIITSRILGFSQEELLQTYHWTKIDISIVSERNLPLATEHAKHLPVRYLAPFDLGQAHSFCHNWFSQYLVGQEREERTKDLFARLGLNDGLSRLARIPVLLNIICFIHARRGRLPDGRAELYRRIAETYLTVLDKARGLRFRDREIRFDYSDLHQWLGKVALEMQNSRDDEDSSLVMPRDRVAAIFRDNMIDAGLSREEAAKETDFILSFIAERSGLFIPKGENEQGKTLFAFSHLSFVEYFAASELRKQAEFWTEGGKEWLDLKEKMILPAWAETIMLFFEQMDNNIQAERYLARLVGDRQGSTEILKDFYPAPVKQENNALSFFNWLPAPAWSLLTSIVMDSAVKLKKTVRQEYIEAIWLFILSDQVQQSDIIFSLSDTIHQLWTKENESLDIFEDNAKDRASLILWGGNISDLKPIAQLSNLTTLDLRGSKISDLKPIAQLSNLTTLYLGGTMVSDLKPIAQLSNLTTLDLGRSKISDLGPIAQLSNLTTLYLGRSKISDLGPIAQLSNLTTLDLRGSKISDLGPISSLKASVYR